MKTSDFSNASIPDPINMDSANSDTRLLPTVIPMAPTINRRAKDAGARETSRRAALDREACQQDTTYQADSTSETDTDTYVPSPAMHLNKRKDVDALPVRDISALWNSLTFAGTGHQEDTGRAHSLLPRHFKGYRMAQQMRNHEEGEEGNGEGYTGPGIRVNEKGSTLR